jgi:hypothetical protein
MAFFLMMTLFSRRGLCLNESSISINSLWHSSKSSGGKLIRMGNPLRLSGFVSDFWINPFGALDDQFL